MNLTRTLGALAALLMLAPAAMADPLDPVLGPPSDPEDPRARTGGILLQDIPAEGYGPVDFPGQPVPDFGGLGPQTTPEVGQQVGSLVVYDQDEDLCVTTSAPIDDFQPFCVDRDFFAGADGQIERGEYPLGIVPSQTTQPVPGFETPDAQPVHLVDEGATPSVYLYLHDSYEYDCGKFDDYVGVGSVSVYGPASPTQEDARWLAGTDGDEGRGHEFVVKLRLLVDGETVFDGNVVSIPYLGHAWAYARHAANGGGAVC